MSGWNGDPPHMPFPGDGRGGAVAPPLPSLPSRPKLSGQLARAANMAMDERLSYTERALACRVTTALAAAEVTLAAQAQTLAILGIGDQLGAILGVLKATPGAAPGAPVAD